MEEKEHSENIHESHRDRKKKLFVDNGIDGFGDHEVLELLLFYAVARRDVNPLAHALLNRFGSLTGVFDAEYRELLSVEGVGEHTAVLIKLLPQVSRRYLVSRSSLNQLLNSSAQAGSVLVPYFFGATEELVYLLCMDGKYKPLGVRLIGHGTVGSANASIRKVVQTALALNASTVILAHNHPSGNAYPSQEDLELTRRLMETLRAVDVLLADHLIVADGDFISMRDSNMMQ